MHPNMEGDVTRCWQGYNLQVKTKSPQYLSGMHSYIHKYSLNLQYIPNANVNAGEASGRPTWLSPYDSHLFKFFEAKTVDYPYPYGSEPRINRCLAYPRFTSGSLLVDPRLLKLTHKDGSTPH
jgi:hypothetical protein